MVTVAGAAWVGWLSLPEAIRPGSSKRASESGALDTPDTMTGERPAGSTVQLVGLSAEATETSPSAAGSLWLAAQTDMPWFASGSSWLAASADMPPFASGSLGLEASAGIWDWSMGWAASKSRLGGAWEDDAPLATGTQGFQTRAPLALLPESSIDGPAGGWQGSAGSQTPGQHAARPATTRLACHPAEGARASTCG